MFFAREFAKIVNTAALSLERLLICAKFTFCDYIENPVNVLRMLFY